MSINQGIYDRLPEKNKWFNNAGRLLINHIRLIQFQAKVYVYRSRCCLNGRGLAVYLRVECAADELVCDLSHDDGYDGQTGSVC